jgi:hypothetical protein
MGEASAGPKLQFGEKMFTFLAGFVPDPGKRLQTSVIRPGQG